MGSGSEEMVNVCADEMATVRPKENDGLIEHPYQLCVS